MAVRGRRLRWLTIAAIMCACPEAFAADPPDRAELVRAGMEASNTKQWGACIEALTAAAALEDDPKTWGELGLCEERAGRFVSAHDHLFRAMEAAPTQGTRDPWTRYQAALARVKERVAVVIVTAFPPMARVVLDGKPLGPADGRAFAVEPGTHTIGARLAGYTDQVQTRTVRAHDVPTIHFQLVANASVSSSSAATTGAPVAADARAPSVVRSPSDLLVPAWSPRGVLMGLTYLGAATALVSGGTWIGLETDRGSLRNQVSRTACGPAATSPPAVCATLLERGQQRDLAADITLGAGIATGALATAAAIAITLEWRSARAASVGGRSPDAARVSVLPTVSGQGGGLVLGGVW